MRAAVVAEGWATTREDADRMLGDGHIASTPPTPTTSCSLAAALGPSQPVWVAVLDGRARVRPLNQEPGETSWFGRETDAAIDRLRPGRCRGPVLAEALRTHGPIDALGLAAQGVQMGDDARIRVQATTNLLLRNLLPHLVASDHPACTSRWRQFLSSNHLFFLTAGDGCARALTELGSRGVTGSSIVTTMSRSGTRLGIKLAGSDDWHMTEAPPIGQALYYAGQGPDTSLRTWGTARARARRPRRPGGRGLAVRGGVRGGFDERRAGDDDRARPRLAARSSRFKLPSSTGEARPLGASGRWSSWDHAQGHDRHPPRLDGSGRVGAGVATAPIECFRAALLALDKARWSGMVSMSTR